MPLTGPGGNGTGDVTAAGDNTFAGQNTFTYNPTLPWVALSGGTDMTAGKNHWDNFSEARTMAFTLANGQSTSLLIIASTSFTLTFPSSVRAGSANTAITTLAITTGVNIVSWRRVNDVNYVADTLVGAAASAGIMDVSICAHPATTPWTSMPSAETFFFGNAARAARKLDLTNFTQCRIVVVTGAAAYSGAKLAVKYKTTSFSDVIGDYSTIAATGVLEVNLSTSGSAAMVESDWTNIATGAKGDVYVNITGSGGNATASPGFSQVVLQFK